MPNPTQPNPADDHATILALEIGGDDIGAAWLIARRSPNLSRHQIANAAKNEGMRDTFGRRRLAKNEDGSTETADEYLERTSRRELGRRSAITEPLPEAVLWLAADCAEQLGELGLALASGFTQAESAELCGCSVATVERRVAELRKTKTRRIAEQLQWREWR